MHCLRSSPVGLLCWAWLLFGAPAIGADYEDTIPAVFSGVMHNGSGNHTHGSSGSGTYLGQPCYFWEFNKNLGFDLHFTNQDGADRRIHWKYDVGGTPVYSDSEYSGAGADALGSQTSAVISDGQDVTITCGLEFDFWWRDGNWGDDSPHASWEPFHGDPRPYDAAHLPTVEIPCTIQIQDSGGATIRTFSQTITFQLSGSLDIWGTSAKALGTHPTIEVLSGGPATFDKYEYQEEFCNETEYPMTYEFHMAFVSGDVGEIDIFILAPGECKEYHIIKDQEFTITVSRSSEMTIEGVPIYEELTPNAVTNSQEGGPVTEESEVGSVYRPGTQAIDKPDDIIAQARATDFTTELAAITSADTNAEAQHNEMMQELDGTQGLLANGLSSIAGGVEGINNKLKAPGLDATETQGHGTDTPVDEAVMEAKWSGLVVATQTAPVWSVPLATVDSSLSDFDLDFSEPPMDTIIPALRAIILVGGAVFFIWKTIGFIGEAFK